MSPSGHEVVTDGEGVFWVSVDLSIGLGFLVEEFLSEHVLFLGSVRDTVLGDMLEEYLAWGIHDTKGGKGFSEHL